MLGRRSHRSGCSAATRSNTTCDGTSEAPLSSATTSRVSAVFQRQATSRSPKLPASIWSRGEYLLAQVSPAWVRQSPPVAPGCAETETDANP